MPCSKLSDFKMQVLTTMKMYFIVLRPICMHLGLSFINSVNDDLQLFNLRMCTYYINSCVCTLFLAVIVDL